MNVALFATAIVIYVSRIMMLTHDPALRLAELAKAAADRPEMSFGSSNVDAFIIYVLGLDRGISLNSLEGFNEWISARFRTPPQMHWSRQLQIAGVIRNGGAADDQRIMMATVCELIESYLRRSR